MTAPIFIVSLKNSPHRQHISQQFAKYDIPYTLFDAVDCRDGVAPEYEQMVDRDTAYKRLNRHLSDGEIGCALSHHLLYKHIVNNNIPHAIIMEDDAILTDNFKIFIDNAVYKKCGADMVFLYHYFAIAKNKPKRHNNIRFYSSVNTPCSTVAYYITAPVAQALYTASSPICHTADYPIDLTDRFNIQAIYPRIIQHPPDSWETSVISKQRDEAKHNANTDTPLNYLIIKKIIINFFICINLSPHITGDKIMKYNTITFIKTKIDNIWKRIKNKLWQNR